jgi:hypothetical protein
MARRSGLLTQKPTEYGRETLGMFDLGQVPAASYELERAVPQPANRLVCLGGGEHPVALSLYH